MVFALPMLPSAPVRSSGYAEGLTVSTSITTTMTTTGPPGAIRV